MRSFASLSTGRSPWNNQIPGKMMKSCSIRICRGHAEPLTAFRNCGQPRHPAADTHATRFERQLSRTAASGHDVKRGNNLVRHSSSASASSPVIHCISNSPSNHASRLVSTHARAFAPKPIGDFGGQLVGGSVTSPDTTLSTGKPAASPSDSRLRMSAAQWADSLTAHRTTLESSP